MTLCPAYFQLVIIIIIKYFRNLFFVPSGRKSQFLNFLRKVQNANHVTMPPHPTTKSWSAWFDCVEYYADRYLLFEEFVKEEISRGRSMVAQCYQPTLSRNSTLVFDCISIFNHNLNLNISSVSRFKSHFYF